MTDSSWQVVAISSEQTHPVRRVVLRADTPTKDVSFSEDDWPGAVHLGVLDPASIDADHIIATSTWIPRETPLRPGVCAVQLRGMATLQPYQGCGVGAALITAGVIHARALGAELVWANARDAALAFYLREGFEVDGDGFIDDATQLPHHVVLLTVT